VTRIIDTFELRANPSLAAELRDHPGDYIERRTVTTTKRRGPRGDRRHLGRAAASPIVYNRPVGEPRRVHARSSRPAPPEAPEDRPGRPGAAEPQPRPAARPHHAGTLALKDTPKGLDYEFDAPRHVVRQRPAGPDGTRRYHAVVVRVPRRPRRPGMGRGRRHRRPDPLRHRVLGLYDVSPVTYPAYQAATAGVRDLTNLDGGSARARLERSSRRPEATAEERQVIDDLLKQYSTVSPWTAERTLRAIAEEPELLAAVPSMRAHVELEPLTGADDRAPVPWEVAANERRQLGSSRTELPSPTRTRKGCPLMPVHEIEALRVERREAFERMKEINDKAVEEKRGLTAEEQQEYDRLETASRRARRRRSSQERSKGSARR
jgi:hypothetical protein